MMGERITKQWMFMGMAEVAQQRATCQRTKVGCVITDQDGTSVVSIGYNGNAKGLGNSCDHLQDCEHCRRHLPLNEHGLHIVSRIQDEYQLEACRKNVPVPGDCGCIHAEANALIKAPFRQGPLVMYTTLSPCRDCAKLIINSAVKTVFYLNAYRDTAGLSLLEKAGIHVAYLWAAKEQLTLADMWEPANGR